METAIDGIADELARRGHNVAHIASDAGEASASNNAPTYRVIRVPAINGLERRLEVPYPLFGVQLPRVLRREIRTADVVHAHGFLYMPSVFGLALARRANARPLRVLTEHVGHVRYESKLIDRVEALAIATVGRASLRAAEAIVAYNTRVAEELARLAPGRRIDFIVNGVDVRRFRPAEDDERATIRAALGWDDGVPRVLYAGRLVAKKGVELVLSVGDVANEEFKLVLAGPGRLPRPASPSVRVLGPQSRRQLEVLYRAADAFLLPSRGEGFPLSVQEAMASGLPVVMCRDPGYGPHLDGAGEAVRLTEPDPRALSEALRRLLRNESARRASGRAAAEHARRMFSWARAADQHESLYARVRRERGG
jgi:phosphatidylinositol alpha-mannosyltransferase/phosphatidylinositol alpha-1,6-mannosyltransferase